MKRYVRAMTIRDMQIQSLSRHQYSYKTIYNVSYVNPDGFGGTDREYTQDNVPKRVLDFIENDSVNTCHTESNDGWRGHCIYDVFWRKGSPEADVVNHRG